MADTVSVSNFPDSGSVARVAYDLFMRLRFDAKTKPGDTQATFLARQLAVYEQCRNAARGDPIDTSKII